MDVENTIASVEIGEDETEKRHFSSIYFSDLQLAILEISS
jgi:hypothetical protein